MDAETWAEREIADRMKDGRDGTGGASHLAIRVVIRDMSSPRDDERAHVEDDGGPETDAVEEGDESETAPGSDEMTADAEEGEWKFSIDDVGPDGVTEDTSTAGPIEPEPVKLEHALFVLMGVVFTLGILFSGI